MYNPFTSRKETLDNKYIMFVDDKGHCVNCITQQLESQLLTEMELSVSSWNELLHFVGGSLQTSKCAWCLIH